MSTFLVQKGYFSSFYASFGPFLFPLGPGEKSALFLPSLSETAEDARRALFLPPEAVFRFQTFTKSLMCCPFLNLIAAVAASALRCAYRPSSSF
jgi:hypothetical protein